MVEGEDASEAVIIDTQSFRAGGGDDGRASDTAAASFIVAPFALMANYKLLLGITPWVFGLRGTEVIERGEVTHVRRNQYSKSREHNF